MKRLILFAHYDPQARVDPHVRFLLQGLRAHCDELVLVTTAAIEPAALEALQLPVTRAIVRENVGLDFCSWKAGLEAVPAWDRYDEIAFCNDSVYGPLFSLANVINAMSYRNCDFWGITDSVQIAHHVQSYFVVFRAAVVRSAAFREFVADIEPLGDKKEIIRRYEVGLTRRLRAAGFTPAAYFRPGLAPLWAATRKTLDDLRWHPHWIRETVPLYRTHRGINYLHDLWPRLIAQQVPFLKVELLRDHPRAFPTTGLLTRLHAATDYPLELIVDHLLRVGSTEADVLAEGRRLVQQDALRTRSSVSPAPADAQSARGLRSG